MKFFQAAICSPLIALIIFTGCDSGTSPSPEKAGETVGETPPKTPAPEPVVADDPAAVAALEEAGFILKKNDAGNVIEASMNSDSDISDVLKNLSGVPNIEVLAFSGPGMADAGMENLEVTDQNQTP